MFARVRELSWGRAATWGTCALAFLGTCCLVFSLLACGTSATKDILSAEERRWLATNQDRIVLALETTYAPFVFSDANGHTAGLAHEHLRLVESRLGVRFRRREFSNLDDIFGKVRSGEIQVVNAVTETPARAEFLSFTKPYISVPNVILVRKGHEGALREEDLGRLKKVSLVRSYAVTEYLTRTYPEMAANLVSDDLACLLDTSFGRSDAAVIDLATASYLIETKGITNLQVAGETRSQIRLSVGIAKTEPQLLAIFQKGLGAITDAEHQAIRNHWISAAGQSPLASWKIWAAAGGLLVLVLIAITLVLVWNRILRRKVALRTQALAEESAALKESEALFSKAFAVCPDGFVITRLEDGVYLEINEGFTQLTGFRREDIIGRSSISGALPVWPDPKDREGFVHALRENGEVIDLEATFLKKDRTTFTALVSAKIFLAHGEKHILSITRDITEQKRIHAALRDSEKRLRDILNSVNAYVFIKDASYRYTYVNPKVCELFGLPAEEILGKGDDAFFPADSVREIRESDHPVIERGEMIAREERNLSAADRQPRTYWAVKIPLRDDAGKIYGLCGISTDITSLKEAEEARSLLQAQLHQAQKLDSLGSLAGGVAHDMNNVLGAILGLATANLQSHPPGSPTYDAFATIAKAATRGGTMVRSLLGFARQSPAEELELDLNTLLQEEARLLAHTTLSRVQLKLDLAPDLGPMRGDASALTHAFMNLCVNAVDAMPETGTLILRTRNLDSDWIEIEVEDNGTGMSKEVVEKAPDPFFTTKGVDKGTGLGLSMVFSTVKAHRGQMTIQSELGQGTRVALRFPVCAKESQVQGLDLAVAKSKPSLQASLNVLLVDDDELIQSSTLELFKTLGHCMVSAVLTGEEALAQVEAGLKPDLVLLDINMPGLGGAGTLPRLRALCPTVPILLVTGQADQAAQTLVSTHPGVNLLSKPFGLRDLRKYLESIGLG
ncbi:MAG TPA: transporter substrate-binding domain-containing protein [Geothrix sp.]|nr:transporter substrate-binding domain-containing protein [Geothrix sp.]